MMSDSGMREVIFSLKSPAVFQRKISDWDMLNWTEEDWSRLFGNKFLPFRCGVKKCTPTPQWERTCKTQLMMLDEFFKGERESCSDSWKYFDYKYINQWMTKPDAFQSLSWAYFGFPEITLNDCTLWIGSSGSHTPCHMDTYGCNLVAQLYGHKQWILFPPSEGAKLKMSRVPYEESSIYSSLNFNSPLGDVCSSLDSAHIVTLGPGDVLFVPSHWWHYVENLDTAIAINTWIPLPNDDDSRMSEVLTRFLISQIASNLSSEQASNILNPNEDDLRGTGLETAMSQVELCIGNCLEASKKVRYAEENVEKIETCIEGPEHNVPEAEGQEDVTYNSPDLKRKRVQNVHHRDHFDNTPLENHDFKVLSSCKSFELQNILDAKCKCESPEKHAAAMRPHQCSSDPMELLPAVINAFCHPEVIERVTKHLLSQFEQRTFNKDK